LFPLELFVKIIVFIAGAALSVSVLISTIRTFVLPRSARSWLTTLIFVVSRSAFDVFTRKLKTYDERDRVMALYGPITLTLLPIIWLTLVLIGYMGMFWAVGIQPLEKAFVLSGSSLLTLGFEKQDGFVPIILSFTEATVGLLLIALLIAYLPTIYSAFARREMLVTLLEVRAGSPPSAVEMIDRFHRLDRFGKLNELWVLWENFFVDIEESHSSLVILAFFRSPQPHRSWVTAAGAVLDAAALINSTVDIPHDTQADLTIRAGYLALRHIASFFRIHFNPNPQATDPISISRLEYDIAVNYLVEKGVPIKADRDQAWRNFAGWRVNYDTVLLALCAMTMAPYAPWSSDRSLRRRRPIGGGTLLMRFFKRQNPSSKPRLPIITSQGEPNNKLGKE
jgi:hypothetical protein